MTENLYNLNSQIFLSNNNLLLEIINDICQIMNNTKDDLFIKSLSNIIIKANNIINENKKNIKLLKSEFLKTFDQMNKEIEKSKINSVNDQLKVFEDGNYIGQIMNGMAEGKGIWYGNKDKCIGERYEGYWEKDKKSGKGIYYYNNGEIYNGDWKDGNFEGKGTFFYKNGNRYEGEWKNDKREGKGIIHYKAGDRYEGD